MQMIEIIDTTSAEGVVRMAFHQVELHLEFVRVAPEVIPFADGDVFALCAFEIDEIDASVAWYGMEIRLAQDRFDDVRIFCRVFPYDLGS